MTEATDMALERDLRALAGDLAIPRPSAGLAAAVAARIEREAPSRERVPVPLFPRVRRSVLLAIAATLVLAAAAAAAIGFNLPGLRILFGPGPSLAPTPSASATGMPGSLLGLGTPLTTDDAQAILDFEIQV